MCLTKTRLKNQPLLNIYLPHYKFIHENVTNSAAGGVAIYVSNRYRCQLCLDQYQLNSSECLWLEVSENVNSQSKFIVGVVYRHPVQTLINNFLGSFSTCLTHLSKSKTNFYILGDFNINLHHANRTQCDRIYQHNYQ